MKKMRGFADPITLGFILSALIGVVGTNVAAHKVADQGKLVKAPVPTVSVELSDR